MFESTRRASTVLALALALVVAVRVPAAWAQSSWAVAERDADHITKLVDNLQGYTDTLPGGAEAPAWVLYRQITADAQEKTSKICLNMIVEVRDPQGVPADLLAPYVWWSDGEVTIRASFVLRGDDVEKKGEGELVEGREDVGTPQVVFDFGDLQKGDVFGWSIVTEQEGPYPSLVAPMAERVPMVISNVTSRGNDKYVYRVHWQGMEPSELDIKEQEPRDSKAMMLKISANQRPAAPERAIAPPFAADVPRVVLTLEEAWLESKQTAVRSGWVSTQGWNQIALALASSVKDLGEKTKGLDITLSAITTGKKTAQEKAAAITEYVRTKFTLLEGPDVDAGGLRDLPKVMKAKEGTRTELLLLTAAMMRQSDVPVSIAPFRAPEHGTLDREWQSPAQFTEGLLRVEADGQVVYYAPHCAGCEPGTYPPSWSGAEVLVADGDLATSARAELEAMQKKALAAGSIDPAAMQAEVAQKPWSRFEVLP